MGTRDKIAGGSDKKHLKWPCTVLITPNDHELRCDQHDYQQDDPKNTDPVLADVSDNVRRICPDRSAPRGRVVLRDTILVSARSWPLATVGVN